MEDLIVDAEEHKLLSKFKKKLEKRYNVEIRMPCSSSFDSDIIFVSIYGTESNRDCVKNFLSKEKGKSSRNVVDEGVTIITLSDSEEEWSSIDSEEADTMETSSSCSSSNFGSTLNFHNCREDSVCVIETSPLKGSLNISDHGTKGTKRKQTQEVRSKAVLPSSDADTSKFFTSIADGVVRKKAKLNESVIILEEPIIEIDSAVDSLHLHKKNNSIKQKRKSSKEDTLKATPAVIESDTDFIPLTKISKSQNSVREDDIKGPHFIGSSIENKIEDEIMIIDEPEVTRSLRPIVIDGSNVAFAHGNSSVFSVKGIQIAVDYFLNRGHTQVTAFVPKFRRNPNPKRPRPTTDAEILDELEKKQHVVFTPSRKLVNGPYIASHDDRFIVQLASTNGGVIVSNDNFRDLVNENDLFKEAIEKRLLMYCFVGDVFMIPDDPLGRKGPKLDEFLSFPPETKKEKS